MFRAGEGIAYAQLGHGGRWAVGDIDGDIVIDAEVAGRVIYGPQPPALDDITDFDMRDYLSSFVPTIAFTGGEDASLMYASYAQLGHGGYMRFNSANHDAITGNIEINSEGGVVFLGGNGETYYAQLGHGGAWSTADCRGSIWLDVDRAHYHLEDYEIRSEPSPPIDGLLGYTAFQGGDGKQAYAQLGHGGFSFHGESVSGAIDVDAGNLLVFQGGGGDDSYTQLGHGGTAPLLASSIEGNINVSIDENAIVAAPGVVPENGNGSPDSLENMNLYAQGFGAVLFDGGDGGAAYAQLGHGGYGRFSSMTGNIALDFYQLPFVDPGFEMPEPTEGLVDVRAERLGILALHGGNGGSSYAQIGHGGDAGLKQQETNNPLSGAIDVRFGPELNGNHTIDSAGDTAGLQQASGNPQMLVNLEGALLAGGDGVGAYTQIGNGGLTRKEVLSGNIRLEAADVLVGMGGTNEEASVQIGHGGLDSGEFAKTGNIDILLKEGANLSGGGVLNIFGDVFEDELPLGLPDSGFLTAPALGGVFFRGGDGRESFVQIGHGGAANQGPCSGNLSISVAHLPVTATDDGGHGLLHLERLGLAAFMGGDGPLSYAQFGHGGRASEGTLQGNISLEIGDVEDEGYPFPGNGEEMMFAKLEGAALLGGEGATSYAQIGHGGFDSKGNSTGDLQILPGDVLLMMGGNTNSGSYVHVGHGGPANVFNWGMQSGNINVQVNSYGGALMRNLEENGGTEEPPQVMGLWDIGAVVLAAGSGEEIECSYAQIGHGGAGQAAEPENEGVQSQGAISINAGNALFMGGGETDSSYAQIGHGGYDAGTWIEAYEHDQPLRFDGAIDVEVTQGGTISNLGSVLELPDLGVDIGELDGLGVAVLLAGMEGEAGYAQIGHGGQRSKGSSSGAIELDCEGLFAAIGGAAQAYAQLGHGGHRSNGSGRGDILLEVSGTFPMLEGELPVENDAVAGMTLLMGGDGELGSAQMGHGGAWTWGYYEGNIDLMTEGAVVLQAGNGEDSAAQIGHGGPGYVDPIGNITVSQPQYLVLQGGDGPYSPARIGHGGVNDTGEYDLQGDIFIDVRDAAMLYSGEQTSYWIGHAGGNVLESDIVLLTGLLYTDDSEPVDTFGAVLGDRYFIDLISQNLMYGDFTFGVRGGSDLRLDMPVITESTYTLTLATSGDFINNTGETEALEVEPMVMKENGPSSIWGVERWLIYSNNPDDIVKGDLEGWEQFESPFFPLPCTPPLSEGNGFLYVTDGEEPPPVPPIPPEPPEQPSKAEQKFRGTLAYDHFVRHWQGVINETMQRLVREQSGEVAYAREKRNVFEDSMAGSSSFFHKTHTPSAIIPCFFLILCPIIVRNFRKVFQNLPPAS